MRKSGLFLVYIGVLCALLTASLLDAGLRSRDADTRMAVMAGRVKSLELTDLSLFTEARYTRHLTQADRHTAFQDHPLALEHFPSGSLVGPPAMLSKTQ